MNATTLTLDTVVGDAAKRHSEALRTYEIICDIVCRMDSRQITFATAKAQALWCFPPAKTRDQLRALATSAKEAMLLATEEYAQAQLMSARMIGRNR